MLLLASDQVFRGVFFRQEPGEQALVLSVKSRSLHFPNLSDESRGERLPLLLVKSPQRSPSVPALGWVESQGRPAGGRASPPKTPHSLVRFSWAAFKLLFCLLHVLSSAASLSALKPYDYSISWESNFFFEKSPKARRAYRDDMTQPRHSADLDQPRAVMLPPGAAGLHTRRGRSLETLGCSCLWAACRAS